MYEKAHTQAQARASQMDEAHGKVQAMTQELSKLEAMGDAITTKDVVRTAARLVANRVADPKQLAVTLTSMPSTGAALAEWVRQHLAKAQAVQAQTDKAQQMAKQQQGAAAFQLMMGHMMSQGPQAPEQVAAAPQPETPNAG